MHTPFWSENQKGKDHLEKVGVVMTFICRDVIIMWSIFHVRFEDFGDEK